MAVESNGKEGKEFNYHSAALGCVECALASNDLLTRAAAAAAGFAADLGDGIPVIHDGLRVKEQTR
jgi:hypothetical protein